MSALDVELDFSLDAGSRRRAGRVAGSRERRSPGDRDGRIGRDERPPLHPVADAPAPVAAVDSAPARRRTPEQRSATRRAVTEDEARPVRRTGPDGVERRTVTIQGRGSERYRASAERRPSQRAHERSGFRPDRAAMWAVMLGVVMILAAATSSHAAVLRPAGSQARLAQAARAHTQASRTVALTRPPRQR
jgi:hypothetical protein